MKKSGPLTVMTSNYASEAWWKADPSTSLKYLEDVEFPVT
jgi:hypothetical protein